MLSFSIEITGLDNVLKQLDSTKEVLQDLEPEMTAIGDYLVDFFSNDVWESEGQELGEQWAQLSPKYQAWKAKNYPGRGILERTGQLRQGFQALPAPLFCIIRNTVDYGVYSEFGTENMPARVFMRLDQERADIIRDMIIESLDKRIKEAVG